MYSLSIVIPAYNEETRLPGTLARVAEWIAGRALTFSEIVVVDDGSQDHTADVVQGESRSNSALRLLRNPGNQGKGYAVRHGMLDAQGEWILYSDADLSTPIEEVDKLYSAAVRAQASIAIGSRALDRSLVSVHQPMFREYSGQFFNVAMRALTGLPFRDTQCGFKLYHSEAARVVFSRQQLTGFSFDVEDLFIAKRCNLKSIEVPVRWANVTGTKVSLSQGLRSFSDLI
ncbi:MAG: glycosyltransferase family 2 protein, partial [Acidobacteriota bacterium]|nr:glycosyltransferase family 2 protein [Acidobacteriota bacterium]